MFSVLRLRRHGAADLLDEILNCRCGQRGQRGQGGMAVSLLMSWCFQALGVSKSFTRWISHELLLHLATKLTVYITGSLGFSLAVHILGILSMDLSWQSCGWKIARGNGQAGNQGKGHKLHIDLLVNPSFQNWNWNVPAWERSLGYVMKKNTHCDLVSEVLTCERQQFWSACRPCRHHNRMYIYQGRSTGSWLRRCSTNTQ